jgi:hypothetical protein
MKTIFFPFTSIDARHAELLSAVWGPLTLLQPCASTILPGIRTLQEDGLVELLFPETDPEVLLMDTMNAFEQWAAQNTGGDLAAMMEQGQTIPFFSSQSSTQIVAELRQRGGRPAQRTPESSAEKKIFQARLLLAMAEKFDRQQEDLGREIENLAAKERRMMALLKGEEEEDGAHLTSWEPFVPAQRQDAPLIDLRLKAWAQVMAAIAEAPSGGLSEGTRDVLFLTISPSAMAYIRERFPEAHIRAQALRLKTERIAPELVENLPPWLALPLTALSVEASREAWRAPYNIDLLEIPGLSRDEFFHRLADERQGGGADSPARTSAETCWIGCMTMTNDASR